ncbi:WG repeat-containing protein [Chitinophaga sp. CF118]|uniref:WG repeat-containing protein n=1 Tax=Chitinophaga sp. CF118 TaxID=1884367 RepID=UPI0015A6CAE9|nr:WG repeat-containing protein [Chitinophaga sp. CF118]
MKYIFLLLCISVISCTQKIKDSSQKAPVVREKLKGYMDKNSNTWICEDSTYTAESFGDSLTEYASAMKLDAEGNPLGMGLIDRQGTIIVPIIYDGLTVGFTDSVCQVYKGDKKGLVNLEGKEIVAPTYKYINEGAEDGLFRVGKNDLYGMINAKGEIVIPIVYKGLEAANEGLVAVMIEPHRWGYINHKNEMVIKPEFTHHRKFENGKVVLQKADGEEYTVYKDGKVEKN